MLNTTITLLSPHHLMAVGWLQISLMVNTGVQVKIHHHSNWTGRSQVNVPFVTSRSKFLLCFSRIIEVSHLVRNLDSSAHPWMTHHRGDIVSGVCRTSSNGDPPFPPASELSLSILTLWPMYMDRCVCESVLIWLYSWILQSDPCHESRVQGEVEHCMRILGAEIVLTCSLRLSQADPNRSSRARAEMDGKMFRVTWGADA
jgi:hypothetical protein